MDIYWEYEYGNHGNIIYNIPVWSFGTFFVFSYREESSQLTFIFFRGVGIPPTRLTYSTDFYGWRMVIDGSETYSMVG